MKVDRGTTGDRIRYGPRGKYFTEVVSKDPVPVLIGTRDGRVEGVIYVHPDNRLLDEINEGPAFLAVTEARVHENGETVMTNFLALNRDQVHWVIPRDEMRGREPNDD